MIIRFLISFLFSLSIVACGGSGSNSNDTNDDNSSGENNNNTNTDDTNADDPTTNNTGVDTPDNLSGNVRLLGVITVGEDAQDNAVDATGAFIRYSSDIAINLINPLYTPQLDVCSVDMINVSDLPTDFPVTNVATEIVSAGEVIPFTSSAGSYIQLLRQNQSGFQYYAPQPETVPGPIPGSLTVDIPGDVFPAFANLSMPTVQPLTLNSPTAGQPVTPTSSFSWTQGTNNNAYVSITVSAAAAAGVMIVECNVNDDGDFSFPAQTQSDMGSTFISIGVDYDRVAHSVQQQGNALVVLTTTSGN